MKKCCIISAGDVNLTLLNEKKSEYDFFIAADAGYDKAIEAGIIPHLAVGDFDSISQSFPYETATQLASRPQFIRFPVDKDFSDTHLAIEEGMNQGYLHFDVYGALGGARFSHSLANIQTLCTMKQKGASVTLIGQKEKIVLLHNESLTLTQPMHSTFSVFSLSDVSTKVTVSGAKYPLDNATLANTFPLGLSNQSISESLRISVKDGFLLVILEF